MLITIAVAAVPAVLIISYAISVHLVRACYHGQSSATAGEMAAKFLQGISVIWSNPFFLGLASAKVFSPCLFMENLYNGNLLSWSLFIVRLTSLVVCVAFWNWLYRHGFQSVGHYLKYRYNSQWIIALYNLNTLFGFVYLYKVELVPVTYYFIEYLKTARVQCYTFLSILLASSMGGFGLTMFSVTALWGLDLAGQVITMTSLSSIISLAERGNTTSILYVPCLSNLGLPNVLPILSHLIAILPFYRYFRAASSLKKANVAMVICAGVLTYDQLWSMILANKVREVGNSPSARQNGFSSRPNLWVRYFLHGIASADGSNADSQAITWKPPAQMNGTVFEQELWAISPGAKIVLLWSMMGQLHMFSIVQLHSLTVHVLEHCVPSWLREGLIASIAELKIIYVSIRSLFSVAVFLIVAEGIYKLNHVAFKELAFYTPTLESELTTIMATVILLGPVLQSAGSSFMITASVIQLVGTHFILGMLARDRLEIDFVRADIIWTNRSKASFQVGRLCGMVWLPTLMTLSFLLVLVAMVYCFRFSRDNLAQSYEGSEFNEYLSREDSGEINV